MRKCLIVVVLSAVLAHAFAAETDDLLAAWREGVTVRAVALNTDRHAIHAYFNTCPESPDGKHVLYYTSATPAGEMGDIRILERATGKETIIARDIVTEDAHRAACQQWSNGGKYAVYHDCKNKHWRVVAVEIATLKEKILAEDRQLCFGSATGTWIPVYGCHWNPGVNRNLELINVVTGEIKTPVTAEQTVKEYAEYMQKKFGSTDISIFFPVMSPDESKVFFKLSRPSNKDDFRTKAASMREGKVIYDLVNSRFIRLVEQWGHPSWTPDSKGIFEKGNYVLNVESGKAQPRYAPSCFSDHPSVSPDGKLFVTDADVTKRIPSKTGTWAIGVGSTKKDEFVMLHQFDNSQGAKSWRKNHPHPAFSADGRRIYFNVNDGEWTRLMVAEAAPGK